MKKRGSSTAKQDDFSNIFTGYLTESAAGTLTFSNRLEMGYSLGDNIGLVLHRIEYSANYTSMNLMLDESDYVTMGMVTSNSITSLLPYGSNVVDFREIQRAKFGTAASGWERVQPLVVSDYTNLPGGGLLIAPNPLYIALIGVSMASVFTIRYRFYYTTVTLNDKGFRELWETWNAIRV